MEMKTIIFLFVLLITILLFILDDNSNPLQKREFEDYKIEFREEIENLNFQLDSIRNQLNTVKINVDTLKMGQIVIYNEIREENTTYLSKLKNLFK